LGAAVKLAVSLIFGLALVSNAARAEDKLNCDEPPDTASENQCADIAFQKADKELNVVWPKIKAWAEQNDRDSDNPGTHDYLKGVMASQRAWLAYRDAECVMAGLPMRGGSGEGPLIGGCRAALTEDRVKNLKGLLPE
jgi:uncharacterized protein YecT (DUF1311 family)